MKQESAGFFKRHKKLSLAIIGVFLFIWTLPILLVSDENVGNTDMPTLAPTPTPTPSAIRLGTFFQEFEENEIAAIENWENREVIFSAIIVDIRTTLGTPYIDLGIKGDMLGKNVSCKFKDSDEVTPFKVGDSVSATVRISDFVISSVMAKDCRLSVIITE